MKIKKIEEALKEIREREDYLTRLRWGKKIDFYHYVPKLDGDSFKPLTLTAKEKAFLKASGFICKGVKTSRIERSIIAISLFLLSSFCS